jgi:hypothetical protein
MSKGRDGGIGLFLGDEDSHYAARDRIMHGLRKSSLGCQLDLLRSGGEAIEARANVSILFPQSEALGGGYDKMVEIPLLEGAELGVLGAMEVEDCCLCARFEDALEFLEAGGNIDDVAQSVAEGGCVEVLVGEGEVEGIAFNPGDGEVGRSFCCHRQLCRREVHAVDCACVSHGSR